MNTLSKQDTITIINRDIRNLLQRNISSILNGRLIGMLTIKMNNILNTNKDPRQALGLNTLNDRINPAQVLNRLLLRRLMDRTDINRDNLTLRDLNLIKTINFRRLISDTIRTKRRRKDSKTSILRIITINNDLDSTLSMDISSLLMTLRQRSRNSISKSALNRNNNSNQRTFRNYQGLSRNIQAISLLPRFRDLLNNILNIINRAQISLSKSTTISRINDLDSLTRSINNITRINNNRLTSDNLGIGLTRLLRLDIMQTSLTRNLLRSKQINNRASSILINSRILRKTKLSTKTKRIIRPSKGTIIEHALDYFDRLFFSLCSMLRRVFG